MERRWRALLYNPFEMTTNGRCKLNISSRITPLLKRIRRNNQHCYQGVNCFLQKHLSKKEAVTEPTYLNHKLDCYWQRRASFLLQSILQEPEVCKAVPTHTYFNLDTLPSCFLNTTISPSSFSSWRKQGTASLSWFHDKRLKSTDYFCVIWSCSQGLLSLPPKAPPTLILRKRWH